MKKIISMILVGGRGTRLGDITKNTAKPAVSFGAKYRLIDFTLSNLSNSNIDVCGIVTQYEPFELMNYIGSGASWDLDFVHGGIRFLTPYARHDDVLWQKGTAHAIMQYFHFIQDYQPEYVLILSGDHIYKMDYNLMLNHHISSKAEITIAATKVDIDEANRFGILEINDVSRLINFYEKPTNPPTNLASMGIYIFSYEVLAELYNSKNNDKLTDFGKNIIPFCLGNGKDISVYDFQDYWRDVGTIDSLYEANMDLLEDANFLGLNSSKHLPVYSKSLNLRPHTILPSGKVNGSVIADGCVIGGYIDHSSVAYRSYISKGAHVEDSVLLEDVYIGENAYIKNVIVNRGVRIPNNYRCIRSNVILITQENLLEVGDIFG